LDLIAYWSVLRRHRRIMVVGLFAAAALAFISVMKVSSSGLAWRSPPIYRASTTLEVTQPGSPYARSTLNEFVQVPGGPPASKFADPSRMEYLASYYARVAESDAIVRRVKRSFDTTTAKWGATPLTGADARALPFIEIGALETSPAKAVALANTVSLALRESIATDQRRDRITGEDRLQMIVSKDAKKAEVFQGVKVTRPIMLFLLISILTVIIAFVVDNLRGGRSGGARAGAGGPTGLDIVPMEPERQDANQRTA
jgi:capsular polysaccharide biosynthesis protein